MDGVSCGSPTICIAVGDGGSLTTSDGGVHWTLGGNLLTLNATSEFAASVSCSSPSSCMAIAGGSIYAFSTSDGGQSWSERPPPSSALFLTAGTCSSLNHCVAFGPCSGHCAAVAITTSSDGLFWRRVHLPPGLGPFVRSVSCFSAKGCVASTNASRRHARRTCPMSQNTGSVTQLLPGCHHGDRWTGPPRTSTRTTLIPGVFGSSTTGFPTFLTPSKRVTACPWLAGLARPLALSYGWSGFGAMMDQRTHLTGWTRLSRPFVGQALVGRAQ